MIKENNMRVNLGAFWQDWTEIIPTVWESLKAPAETILPYVTQIQQAKYAAEIGQDYADAQKAVASAQQKIVEAQLAQKRQQTLTEKALSTEAWKKALPYVIPIAAGLAIVVILLLRRKD